MIKSKKPSKQRVYRRTAPMHVRRKMMSSHLSKELMSKHHKRSIPLRKGDEVLIMRGSFKGVKGVVDEINRSSFKVFIKNVVYEKKNGTKVKIGFDASNLMITNLYSNDAKRFKVMNK